MAHRRRVANRSWWTLQSLRRLFLNYMKLLYLSCHAILEYDELKLFEELGIDYFSLGSYIDPQKPVDPIRPPLHKTVNPDLLSIAPERDHMPKEFLDHFDKIIIMHKPEWIENNWEALRGRDVTWRTIGQSTPAIERRMQPFRDQGLKVVRYAKRENNIKDNVGCDKIIHFYKDGEEFGKYNGLNREAITFAQNMVERGEYCNFKAFASIVHGMNAHVYGPKNDEAGELNGGFMTYADLQQKMRDSRVYIYTGTQPASYTLNFVEAFMTGIPMICVGPKYANSLEVAGDTYEIPDLIQNGVNGFVSDDLEYLRKMTGILMNDLNMSRTIGAAGRQTALAFFGKDVIKSKWKEFLGL